MLEVIWIPSQWGKHTSTRAEKVAIVFRTSGATRHVFFLNLKSFIMFHRYLFCEKPLLVPTSGSHHNHHHPLGWQGRRSSMPSSKLLPPSRGSSLVPRGSTLWSPCAIGGPVGFLMFFLVAGKRPKQRPNYSRRKCRKIIDFTIP